MDIEEIIHDTIKDLLERIDLEFSKIEIVEEEKNIFDINITSQNPSLLIGYHGDNIYALQHLLKVLLWKKTGSEDYHITLDVDSYRKRQEESILNLAIRKADKARQYRKAQAMPPMSSALRRKIHLHFMGAGFDDLETYSEGEGENRHLVIKPKA